MLLLLYQETVYCTYRWPKSPNIFIYCRVEFESQMEALAQPSNIKQESNCCKLILLNQTQMLFTDHNECVSQN